MSASRSKRASRSSTPSEGESNAPGGPTHTIADVAEALHLLGSAPILTLPEQVRESEVRRRLRHHLGCLEDTLRDGIYVADRVRRLRAMNIARALGAALDPEIRVADAALEDLDDAARRFTDALGFPILVLGEQGTLSDTNRETADKFRLLEYMRTALDAAKVPAEARGGGRIEWARIEAQWRGGSPELDSDPLMSPALDVAACALNAVEILMPGEATRPVPLDPEAREHGRRAVARSIWLLLFENKASEPNVAFVALRYYGLDPKKLRKNFFPAALVKEWKRRSDEFEATYGEILNR